jgi:cytochrome c oxidase subunit 3
MTLNLNNRHIRIINYQAHPYHMVSPSPWPIMTSMSLLALTVSGALSMHVFLNSGVIFFISLYLVIYSMSI